MCGFIRRCSFKCREKHVSTSGYVLGFLQEYRKQMLVFAVCILLVKSTALRVRTVRAV